MQNLDKFLAYIRGNPGCRVIDVARAFGASRSHAQHALTLLKRNGDVRSELPPVGNTAHLWYAGTPDCDWRVIDMQKPPSTLYDCRFDL